jgi:hypothetical protein
MSASYSCESDASCKIKFPSGYRLQHFTVKKVKVALEHATKVPRGSSKPHPGRFTPRKDSVPIAQQTGWAPEPVWTDEKTFVLTGIFFSP